MSCKSSLRSLLTSLILFSAVFSPLATAGDWREYRSDYFTVYSDASEKRVSNLLRDMERFRQAILFVTRQENTLENQRLQVFYFKSSRQFKKFTRKDNIAGFYTDTWDGPLIFARANAGGFSDGGVAFHEYVHHLMRERGQSIYPKWYSEGFAEFLASARLTKDGVWIGEVPKWRLYAFSGKGAGSRPLPLREILKPDTENYSPLYANSYYAGAWLLTHYLQFGAGYAGKSYDKETSNYFHALKNGEDPLKAFEEHYGKSLDEMQAELNRYARGQLRSRKVTIPEYEGDIQTRKLTNNERNFLLGEKAWTLDDGELAEEYLNKADKKSAGWQENYALLAEIKLRTGDEPAAARMADITESAKIEDYRTAANLALYYAGRLHATKKADEWDEALYRGAVQNAKAAIEMNPAHLPGYRALWIAQQLNGERLEAFKTMMAAYQREPGNLFINTKLGFYLESIDRADLARPFLENVVAWSHSGKQRSRAKKILDSLEAEASPYDSEEKAGEKKSG
ncbi:MULTISPECIES: DUF1570 domain-containing protein [unclassified Microbulbifer]|uniref:DUF1570 domain-containing protein n=1 Tax=unclassified Microbulbifer TaxID=2619833 RepID=UPI0027E456BE|nr:MULTISPECIES: DUF1570 domain-containing protein [unclassified Microbulbifer]